MDWQAMARVAWSRESRLASWTGPGLGLVDWARLVLEDVTVRYCQHQAHNDQPQDNADLKDLSHARPPAAIVKMTHGPHDGGTLTGLL